MDTAAITVQLLEMAEFPVVMAGSVVHDVYQLNRIEYFLKDTVKLRAEFFFFAE